MPVPRHRAPKLKHFETRNYPRPPHKLGIWIKLIPLTPHHEANGLNNIVDGSPIKPHGASKSTDVTLILGEQLNEKFFRTMGFRFLHHINTPSKGAITHYFTTEFKSWQ